MNIYFFVFRTQSNKRELAAMAESSDSVSVDVETIYLGGKVFYLYFFPSSSSPLLTSLYHFMHLYLSYCVLRR